MNEAYKLEELNGIDAALTICKHGQLSILVYSQIPRILRRLCLNFKHNVSSRLDL
jgi:hypothetical protein